MNEMFEERDVGGCLGRVVPTTATINLPVRFVVK
jgi:hypothetical protein